jgi:hypothetical protein
MQAQFPAVVHLDGTGRVQTVSASDNAWLHALLKERRTAVPPSRRLRLASALVTTNAVQCTFSSAFRA